MDKINIFWFRRDLRLGDNPAFYHALQKGNVLPIFIFDTRILEQLPDMNDARVTFIFNQLQKLDKELEKFGSAIKKYKGIPSEILKKISTDYRIDTVFFNEDYEPYRINCDNKIENLLQAQGISCKKYQDHLIFHPEKILKWKESVSSKKIIFYPSETLLHQCINNKSDIKLTHIGFVENNLLSPLLNLSDTVLLNYSKKRNFPFLPATTHLGTYLRFGTVSIRKIWEKVISLNTSLINELIRREFFISILYHYLKVTTQNFKVKYDSIVWKNNEKEFKLWTLGKTGCPMVDAGMRELNSIRLMHNRVCMITASFLCKHLLVDWRWDEAYFASKLLDYELASNNGNRQWASSSGCDAVPYFRIFNPDLQTQKFDPDFVYCKQWIPKLKPSFYPAPIVEHSFARQRALDTYTQALQS